MFGVKIDFFTNLRSDVLGANDEKTDGVTRQLRQFAAAKLVRRQ